MEDLSDLASKCIRCGFCLESCPTFQLTADESQSPRGRIYLAKAFHAGEMPASDAIRKPFESCVGCRACETACPSGVEFGKILEITRDKLQSESPKTGSWKSRFLIDSMSNPLALKMLLGSVKLFPGGRLPNVIAKAAGVPNADIRAPIISHLDNEAEEEPFPLPPIRGEISLLGGCAMSAVFDDVERATIRLARRLGYEVRVVSGCCGALHSHNGYLVKGQDMAKEIAKKMKPSQVLLSTAAGCGSWLKESLPEGLVKDACEFFADEGLADVIARAPGLAKHTKIAYQDACHLVHGQRISEAPRVLLKSIRNVEVVPIANATTCCGSGGIYNFLQPTLATKMGIAKADSILKSECDLVASGNPGCMLWMAQNLDKSYRKVQVLHTLSVLDCAFVNLNLD